MGLEFLKLVLTGYLFLRFPSRGLANEQIKVLGSQFILNRVKSINCLIFTVLIKKYSSVEYNEGITPYFKSRKLGYFANAK